MQLSPGEIIERVDAKDVPVMDTAKLEALSQLLKKWENVKPTCLREDYRRLRTAVNRALADAEMKKLLTIIFPEEDFVVVSHEQDEEICGPGDGADAPDAR